MSSLLGPWAVRAAVSLRLPDLLAEGAGDTAELAARCGAAQDGLDRLLRHLELLGVVQGTSARWENTEIGELLREDHPSRMRRNLDQDDAYLGKVDRSSYGLLAAVRRGGPVWEELYGHSFWDEMAVNPEFGKGFDRLMADYSVRVGPAVATSYDWSSVRHVVDVGGGTGKVLASILRKSPSARGTLVDLPETVENAGLLLDEADVSDRCSVVGQSFFAPLPSGGHVYLLVNVVHNWSDDDGVRILRQCARAASPGARVVLIERLVPTDADEHQRLVASSKDLYMLMLLGGRERGEEDFHRLGTAAGLSWSVTRPLADHPELSLLEYTVD
jgi:hypothetical protein